LQQHLVVGVDPDPTLREQPPDRPVGEDHRAILRRSAAEAARAADWPLAIEEQFRAIAVALHERTLVDVHPGTTATEFAAQASRAAPAHAAGLRQAARTFDEVRYLDRPGSEAGYRQLLDLDGELERLRPAREAVIA